AMIIDVAVDRAADCRTLEQPIADGEAAARAGELNPQARELDAGCWDAGLLRGVSDPLQRPFSAHHEVANIENPLLRRQIGALRIERNPHLAAGELRIHIGEAEEGAGVVTLHENDLAAVAAAPAQVAAERRIASELAVQRKTHDNAATT